jgi:hypothetical protein
MRKTSSATAQPRQGRGLAVTSMRTTALGSTEWAARPIIEPGARPQGGWRVEAAAVRSTLPCISPFHDQDELQPKVGRRFAGGTACRSYRILLQDFGRLLHAALVSTLFFPLECRFIFHRAASGWLVGACPSFPFPSTSKWARLCICHTAMRLKNANTYV